MNAKERKQLPSGLYRIQWRDGETTSLAAVGVTADGERWLAPCNWIAPVDDEDSMLLSLAWRDVKAVTLIEAA